MEKLFYLVERAKILEQGCVGGEVRFACAQVCGFDPARIVGSKTMPRQAVVKDSRAVVRAGATR
jgi:hypothetical protein